MPKKIAFSAQSVAESVLSSWKLYWIAEDGTDLGQLTFDRNAFDFLWSPDGRQIAFNSSSSVEGQRIEAAYLIDEDGSNLRTLLPGIVRRVSSWSSESKLIAFLGY